MTKRWGKEQQEYYNQSFAIISTILEELKAIIIKKGFVLDQDGIKKDLLEVSHIIHSYLRKNKPPTLLLGYIIDHLGKAVEKIKIPNISFENHIDKIVATFFHTALYSDKLTSEA